MKHIYILSLLLCCSFLSSYSQTAESIIEKHIEAHGGIENWEAIENMKITGQFTSFSLTKDFTTILSRPNSLYSEFYMGVHKVIIGYNGEMGWTLDPWFEIPYPRSVNAVEENVMIQKAEFATTLFHYKEIGYKAEFKGKISVEGEEVFHVELTKPNGQIDTWYLNSETYLEYISKSTWSDFGGPCEQESFYSDFRKVGDITIPFVIEREFASRIREISIEKVEFNLKLDKEIFEVPKSEAIKQLKVLEGEWNVKVDVLGRRGWQTADNTSSSIKYLKNFNLLQEDMTYSNGFPVTVMNSWTFDAELKKYKISSFNSFDSKMNIYEGEFKDGALVYLSSNTGEEQKSIKKYIIKDISEKAFNIEVSVSNDNAQNWKLIEKFYYSRK